MMPIGRALTELKVSAPAADVERDCIVRAAGVPQKMSLIGERVQETERAD